jgi:uncharacterized membrane protein
MIAITLLCILTSVATSSSAAGGPDQLASVFDAQELVASSIVECRGVVLTVEQGSTNRGLREQAVKVSVLDGPFAGRVLIAVYRSIRHSDRDHALRPGQRVILSLAQDAEDQVVVHGISVARIDYQAVLAAVFVVTALLFGQSKGLAGLLALLLSGLILVRLLVPALMLGYNPLLASVVAAVLMIVGSLVIIGGFTRKTAAAVLGTVGGTMIAGLLASYSVQMAGITGTAGDDVALLITELGVAINYQGLLMAGVLVGTVGVVMDVAMSISAVIFELKDTSPRITIAQLIRSGLRVGKDIMATMINTLVLAYAGASIPLFLVFQYGGLGFAGALNTEVVAAEVVRALCGSIGLVLTIPLTTAAAAVFADSAEVRRRRRR